MSVKRVTQRVNESAPDLSRQRKPSTESLLDTTSPSHAFAAAAAAQAQVSLVTWRSAPLVVGPLRVTWARQACAIPRAKRFAARRAIGDALPLRNRCLAHAVAQGLVPVAQRLAPVPHAARGTPARGYATSSHPQRCTVADAKHFAPCRAMCYTQRVPHPAIWQPSLKAEDCLCMPIGHTAFSATYVRVG